MHQLGVQAFEKLAHLFGFGWRIRDGLWLGLLRNATYVRDLSCRPREQLLDMPVLFVNIPLYVELSSQHSVHSFAYIYNEFDLKINLNK